MPENSEQLESLIEKIAKLVPDSTLRNDVKKNVRALLQSGFSNMNLVSRDEFEAQSAVLARTREKLEKLEAQLEQLK